MRSRRVLAGLLLVLLLAVPSASALRVTGGFHLGRVDAGSSHVLPVFLDNSEVNATVSGTFNGTATLAQARDATQLSQVPGWLSGEARNWSVPPRANETFGMALDVAGDARPGPYLLLGEFLETLQAPPAGGSVVGVRINHAVGVSFVVRGVDVVGRIAVPQVVKPDAVLPEISLTVGNWLDNNITGHPVQEVWHGDELVRVFSFEDRLIRPTPGAPLASFPYKPDFRGLLEGEYLVRTFVEYRNATGEGGQSVPRDQPLIIGQEVLAYSGHTLTTPVGAFAAPDGTHLELPRGIEATLQLHVANLRPLLGVADLILGVTSSTAPTQTITRTVAVSANAIQEATLPFALDEPGAYDLELREEGTLLWSATIDVQAPVVEVTEVGLSRDRLSFTVTNHGVRVESCHATEVWTAFAQRIPGRAPAENCRLLERGESWRVDTRLDVSGLPDGAYLAHLGVTWTGSDAPVEHDLAFRLPLDTPIQRIVRYVTETDRLPMTLGLLAISLLSSYALFVAWRRRRKKDAPTPTAPAPEPLPAWATTPSLPATQPVLATRPPVAAMLAVAGAAPGMVQPLVGAVPAPPSTGDRLPAPSALPRDLDQIVRALEEAVSALDETAPSSDAPTTPVPEPVVAEAQRT